MKKILLLCFSFVFASFTILAQDRVVSGKVTSADDGSTLPGVNVVVKGSTTGSVTDADGSYKITVPGSGGTLIFSFIGMVSQEVEIGDKTNIDVVLTSDVTQLSEVVVIGYGVQEKRKLTTSIASVSGNAIASLATPSFDSQLAGRAAGVQVTMPSGIIGSTPQILIRGTNSINSGTFPLVVLDGIPMTTGNQSGVTPTNPLSSINPADIESYEILKDGAATAIYGSRAANGVILITTKSGSKNKGKTNIDFTASTGFSKAINKFDLLNAEQFVQVANEKLSNAGLAPAAFMDANNTNTDWQDEVLRTGSFSNYNLGVGGANESTNYYFGLGYQYQEGAAVSNAFERYNFTGRVDHRANKYLKIGTKVQLTRSETTGLNTGSNALSGNLAGGLRLFPNVPVKDPTNATGYNLSADGQVLGQGANTRSIDNNYTNQAFVLANNKFEAQESRLLANAYAELSPIDGLTLRTFFGVDLLSNKDFLSYDPRHGDGRGSNGVVTNSYRQTPLWNWQTTLSYNKEFGGHGIDFVGGIEYQKQTFESFFGQGTNFSQLFFIQHGLISNTFVNQFAGGTYNQTAFQSYFGRLNYSFKDKYLISLSGRYDGLSKLAEANRNGFFPGASIGYVLSSEDFFKNSGITKIVNTLKIRASYAQVGNQDIGGLFPYLGTYGSARYGAQNGIAFSQAGNADLQWETAGKLDIGFDASFLNNKISFTFDYYKNENIDLVLSVPYANSLGIPGNSISQNIGKVSNSGLEFTIGATPVNKNGFIWNINANFTTVNNEVIETFRNSAGAWAEVGAGSYEIQARVGEPIWSIYGYEYAGVNPGNGNPMYYKGDGSIVQRNVNSGTYSFYDANNQTDETNTTGAALVATDISAGGDRKILGKQNPTYYGGLTNSVSWKGISLEILARFSGGNQIYNQTKQDNLLNMDFNNSGTELLKSWRSDNTNTDVPKMWINRSTQVNQTGVATSRFVEDGDFIRIQNIILGYSLPNNLLQKTGNFKLSSVRIFAQVQNAFTFTKYTGIDPELGAGRDNNATPTFRTFTFGLSLGL
jgi:TonB-dependent starch-binding outer membrane protein SusC